MTELGEGELQEARRRRLFWLSIGVLVAAGFVVGGITGFTAVTNEVEIDQIWTTVPQSVAIVIIGSALLAFAYGCWRFYKVIDEVELVDNLWGSTAAYYLYATLFPLWWALAKARILPEPNDWAIYLAALGGGGLIYLGRKWRAR